MYLPRGLLFSLVEHSGDDTKSRSHGSFTNAQEESNRDHTCVVLTGCMTHENSAPQESVYDQVSV